MVILRGACAFDLIKIWPYGAMFFLDHRPCCRSGYTPHGSMGDILPSPSPKAERVRIIARVSTLCRTSPFPGWGGRCQAEFTQVVQDGNVCRNNFPTRCLRVNGQRYEDRMLMSTKRRNRSIASAMAGNAADLYLYICRHRMPTICAPVLYIRERVTVRLHVVAPREILC